MAGFQLEWKKKVGLLFLGSAFHKKLEEVEFWKEITFWLALYEITYSYQKLEKTKHNYYYYLMALSVNTFFFFLILSCGFIKEA